MSSDAVIKVTDIGKCYRIYDRPADRLKEALVPRLQRCLGLPQRHFFREFWALRDVCFEVRRGETVGVIGRNGSGKSTLLQIISGTLNPSTGSVSVKGRVGALLELGSGFNPEFTGRENVYLNGTLLGLRKEQIDQRFDAIAAFADIGGHLDQPVKTYSSGMLVRLAFAVQVQVEPEILIVDEALAVGDALFQKRCFQRIEKLVADGTTVLFVSHDQESIRTFTNRALLLHRGRVLEWGQSSTVVLAYRKLLHEEESAYYAGVLSQKLSHSATGHSEDPVPVSAPASAQTKSELEGRLSFGDGGARITRVQTLDESDAACAHFHPGDFLRIRVTGEVSDEMSKLNVSIRIRNKEGVKIYSWGSLNQDMSRGCSADSGSLFWARHFAQGEVFVVDLDCRCSLGPNLYEIQACVSFEETMNYRSQRILHWLDEAAFFQVSLKPDERFFGGVVDLDMRASW